jgi:hypothetical protein
MCKKNYIDVAFCNYAEVRVLYLKKYIYIYTYIYNI